jgi:hypothetical protein
MMVNLRRDCFRNSGLISDRGSTGFRAMVGCPGSENLHCLSGQITNQRGGRSFFDLPACLPSSW